ncbi:transporter substrate-binding domain-containing protein [Nitratifractor salsuginis]|uniref:histidine kinase n=1 Tax=Nitratifractor salsuginis (strain DSM 16511 / JCM 12458 / E9I37-1) TaxID=749222 RepID=E6WXR7_NITSE|nr:transporter substrate-binding domain-containing protein [Nitratifractor salsuginis]ADV46324.1 histidine kinase [Nitratifractor salsuginis DSM 16511]
MKQFFKILIVTLLTCSSWSYAASPSTSKVGETLEPVTLQLNWLYSFELAGFIAAKEKGFYRDAGLDVTFRKFKTGMDVVNEVLKGKADYGLYSSKLLDCFLQGQPVKLVASFFKTPSIFIVAKPGIKQPEDLKGKTIMVPFSRHDFELNFGDMFRKRDVNISSIKLSTSPYSLDAFIQGKVDAIVLFLPSQLYRLGTLNTPYTIINPGDYSDLTLQQELFTTQKIAQNYPERTLAFRNASIKGWEYALKHPYEIIDIIRKKYAPHKTLEELSYEYRIVKRLIQADLYPIGSIDTHLLLLKIKRDLKLKRDIQAKRHLNKYLFGGGVEMSPLILTKTERDYLKTHPVIKAHNESNWPPFNFNENGQAKGFSIDYMNLIAEKIGVKVKYVSGYTWYEFLQMINSDKLDVIDNIAITKDRKKFVRFTHPYIDLRHAIYTQVNNQVYFSLKDLAGKKVALVQGFFIQQYLAKHYPRIKQVLVPDQLSALKLLSLGRVDAVIGKQVVVDYLMRQYLISNIIATSYVQDPGTISHVALGVSKKDKILARILSKAQKTVTRKELDQLKHKWFGINPLLDSKELLSADEERYLSSHRDLSVCVLKERAPIEFFDRDKAQGIAVEVIDTLTRRLHLNLHYLPAEDRPQELAMLRERRCDIIAAASRGPQNAKLLYFTKPYLEYDEVLVAHHNGKPNSGELSLGGKHLAGWKGDPALRQLKKAHPKMTILEFSSPKEILEAVRDGSVDYALMARPVFNYQKRLLKLDDLEIAGVAPVKASLTIGVRKDELTLYNIFNKIVNVMPKETYYAISDKWTSKRILKEVDWRTIALIVGVALLIILIILFAYWRQRKLSRKIKELNDTLEERIEEALQKNREQELFMLQQDRLAKMGEMIAMIAHQWRQPLNNLSLLIQLLVSKYKKGKLDRESIDYFQNNALKQINQMSTTIDDFRNFYKIEKEPEIFCVNESIEHLINLTRMSFSAKNINIVFDAKNDYYYKGHPNELAHAILNIMNNAKDAFSDRDGSIEHKEIRLSLSHIEEDIVLEICDNAGGIPEGIIDKIFDPYFSTKQDKNGTGLGLYMTRVMIVEHMGSTISVRNTTQGACFTITLKGEWHHVAF